MSLTSEQIKQIIDGAPDKATHVHDDCYYEYGRLHHLSDLAEILTLRERVEQLERELDRYKDSPFIIPLAPKGEHQ